MKVDTGKKQLEVFHLTYNVKSHKLNIISLTLDNIKAEGSENYMIYDFLSL